MVCFFLISYQQFVFLTLNENMAKSFATSLLRHETSATEESFPTFRIYFMAPIVITKVRERKNGRRKAEWIVIEIVFRLSRKIFFGSFLTSRTRSFPDGTI